VKDNIIDFSAQLDKRNNISSLSDFQEQRREAIKKLPQFRGEIPSKNVIRALQDVKEGQIFWVEMDNKPYIVAEKTGKKLTIKALDETASVSTGITIYDMNKNLVSKEPLLDLTDDEVIFPLKERLWTWFNEDTSDRMYMLYGRDIHYVTVFEVVSRREDVGIVDRNELDIIIDALKNVGRLISIDFNTGDGEMCLEIWIRTNDSAAELLYLFPYDKALIEI
jgi:hypothetical protein